MTTPEVIQVLLSKFHITDNPRKFALYEKVLDAGGKAGNSLCVRLLVYFVLYDLNLRTSFLI